MKNGCKVFAVSFAWFLAASCVFNPLGGAENALYLVPERFEGPVVIIFDCPNGIETEIDMGKIVYRIPPNGILRVAKSPTYRIGKEEFLFVGDGGSQSEISYVFPSTEAGKKLTFADIAPDDSRSYAFGSEMGSFNYNGHPVQFRSFEIGPISKRAELHQMSFSRIDGIQKGIY